MTYNPSPITCRGRTARVSKPDEEEHEAYPKHPLALARRQNPVHSLTRVVLQWQVTGVRR